MGHYRISIYKLRHPIEPHCLSGALGQTVTITAARSTGFIGDYSVWHSAYIRLTPFRKLHYIRQLYALLHPPSPRVWLACWASRAAVHKATATVSKTKMSPVWMHSNKIAVHTIQWMPIGILAPSLETALGYRKPSHTNTQSNSHLAS